jgi:taurine dioxygenase
MSKPENPVPGYTHLLIEPYTPGIGALVHDFDLAGIADAGARAELRKALAEFQVLFFRDQKLSPAEQIAVARVFGDPDKAKAFFPRHATEKFIEVLEARPGVNRYGTDQWHADITFVANPPTGTVLYAHIVPESGGDTVWASATAVHDSLPRALQQYLENSRRSTASSTAAGRSTSRPCPTVRRFTARPGTIICRWCTRWFARIR